MGATYKTSQRNEREKTAFPKKTEDRKSHMFYNVLNKQRRSPWTRRSSRCPRDIAMFMIRMDRYPSSNGGLIR